jgi:uncharacterized membrane protein
MNFSIKEKNRIAHYDILRGLAISLMLMANSAASVYTATPPLLMRLMGSFAAPSFMILVGMMLALSKKPQPMRGLYIIATGCLLDVAVWRIVPFMTFDVLYTIGMAIVITAYPARFFSERALWFTGCVFILSGEGLQLTLGYQHDILDIPLPLPAPLPPIPFILSRVLHQLLITGWFPLFPWLGFIWLGAALQRSLQRYTEHNKLAYDNGIMIPRRWLLYSVLLLIVSAAYWASGFVAPEPRQGYSELFYPADAGFCFTATSTYCVILFIFQSIIRWQPILFILMPLRWLGQRSLWIYILHLLIIRYLLLPYFVTADLHKFLYTSFILWLFCVLTARLLLAYPFVEQEKR